MAIEDVQGMTVLPDDARSWGDLIRGAFITLHASIQDLDALEATVATEQSNIDTLQTDVGTLQTDTTSLRTDLTSLQAQVDAGQGTGVLAVSQTTATLALDVANGSLARVTLGNDVTVGAPLNAPDGVVVGYIFENPADSGSIYSVTMDGTFYHPPVGETLDTFSIKPGGRVMVTTFSDIWATEGYVQSITPWKEGTEPIQALQYVAVGAHVPADNGASLVFSPPAGTQGGDLISFCISSRFTGTVAPTITPPTGATLVRAETRDSLHGWVYHLVAGGAAGSATTDTSYTFTNDGTGNVWHGAPYVIRNAAAAPVGATDGNTSSGQLQSPAASITTTADDSVVLHFVATGDDNNLTLLTAEGFTARASGSAYTTTTNNDGSMGLADKLIPTSGTVVTLPTWEQAINGPDTWMWIAVEIKRG